MINLPIMIIKTIDSWSFSFKPRIELTYFSVAVNVRWEKKWRREEKMARLRFCRNDSFLLQVWWHQMKKMKEKIKIFSDSPLERWSHECSQLCRSNSFFTEEDKEKSKNIKKVRDLRFLFRVDTLVLMLFLLFHCSLNSHKLFSYLIHLFIFWMSIKEFLIHLNLVSYHLILYVIL